MVGGVVSHMIFQRRTGMRKLPAVCVVVGACFFASAPAVADIDNTATASGTYNSTVYTSPPSSESVPVTSSTPTMNVTKTASATVNVTAGQLITYTYTVTNTGSQTLTNIALSENHNGSGPTPVPGNETLSNDMGALGDSTDATPNDGVWSVLGPGDTTTFTATYLVTQTDINNRQ
jgi:large repetitive protein